MKEKLIDQAEQLGFSSRMFQCMEEMGELTQAFCKLIRVGNGDKTCKTKREDLIPNISEEIADVEICTEQIKYLLGIEKEVDEWKEKKIKRTDERLKGNNFFD